MVVLSGLSKILRISYRIFKVITVPNRSNLQ